VRLFCIPVVTSWPHQTTRTVELFLEALMCLQVVFSCVWYLTTAEAMVPSARRQFDVIATSSTAASTRLAVLASAASMSR
jgi:hypothetical protein